MADTTDDISHPKHWRIVGAVLVGSWSGTSPNSMIPLTLPSTMGIISTAFSSRQRGLAMAIWAGHQRFPGGTVWPGRSV